MEKNGEGDHATAQGETQITPSSQEVFPGSSWNACPGTGGTGGTLSVAYIPRWNDSRLQIRSDHNLEHVQPIVSVISWLLVHLFNVFFIKTTCRSYLTYEHTFTSLIYFPHCFK